MLELLVALLVCAPKVLIVGLLIFAFFMWMSNLSFTGQIVLLVVLALVVILIIALFVYSKMPPKPRKADKIKELN